MGNRTFRAYDDRERPRCHLYGCQLSGYDFTDAHCHEWNFRSSIAMRARFDRASLVGSQFEHTCLKGASFAGADLTGCEFRWCDLRGSDFTGATLPGFRAFTGARLSGATGLPARWVAWARAFEADLVAENPQFWGGNNDPTITPRRRGNPTELPFRKSDRRRVAKGA